MDQSAPGAPSWMTALPTETQQAQGRISVASSDELDGLSSGTLLLFFFFFFLFLLFPSPPFPPTPVLRAWLPHQYACLQITAYARCPDTTGLSEGETVTSVEGGASQNEQLLAKPTDVGRTLRAAAASRGSLLTGTRPTSSMSDPFNNDKEAGMPGTRSALGPLLATQRLS